MNIGTNTMTLISMTKIMMIGKTNRNSTETKEEMHYEKEKFCEKYYGIDVDYSISDNINWIRKYKNDISGRG